MESNQNTLNLTQGMDVFGSDGEKVGSVQDVQGEYVIVSKGFFFPTDYYIPFSALGNADEGSVYLNVTKDEALNQGWDAVPDTTAATTTYDEQPITDAGLHVDQPVSDTTNAGLMDTEDRPFDHHVDGGTVAHDDVRDGETINVPLTEEELTAERRTVDRGAVRVEKDVVEEDVSLDVPVTREEVHVSRRTVDRDVTPGDATFEEGTIEVPVHGEEVDVQKQTRVREELEISKEAVQDTEHVTGTVRREEARVEGDVDDVDRPVR
ncbi:MAG: DUF2382 domain-containing protein [Chloroflexia bacterium]|nr:DUF2382 domain-containing protein [Chloroflexia bacterium]